MDDDAVDHLHLAALDGSVDREPYTWMLHFSGFVDVHALPVPPLV